MKDIINEMEVFWLSGYSGGYSGGSLLMLVLADNEQFVFEDINTLNN